MSVSLSKKVKSFNKEFDKIFLNVVDHSLERIGKSVGPVVYYNLEKGFIKKKEIPVKTERFSACLKMIFGEGVAYLIEMSIVEKLYLEIGEEFVEEKESTFTGYVNNARKKYLEMKSKRYPEK